MLSIDRILPRARELYATRPAIVRDGAWLSYEDLGCRVDALVRSLRSLGVAAGDRVALLDVNSPTYLELYYACAQAGFVFVPLNSRLSGPELEYILKDCGAAVLVISPPFFDTMRSLDGKIPDVRKIVATGAGLAGSALYDDLIEGGKRGDAQAEETPIARSGVAQIYYTSGTTGEPKGVCLTYDNMAVSAVDSLVGLAIDWNDCWLHSAPLFHLVDAWAVWAMPLIGARQLTLSFSPDAFIDTVTEFRPTMTALPPTLIGLVCAHPRIADADMSSLRLIMYGGSPMPLGTLARAKIAIPTSYIHAYGITETSGITTLLRPESINPTGNAEDIKVTCSAGQPVVSTTVAICDDTGARLPQNEIGEIVIGGPRVMKCYWNKQKATDEVLRDGRYHSGDLGYLDSYGNLHIVDRKKDMIITGGENVYSAEVENILSTHPNVIECAVIGVPSPQWGEAVHAVVVTARKDGCTTEDLLSFCRGKIAGYKIPKSIAFSDTLLPKTGPGKIAKRKIRETYWRDQQARI